MDIRDILSLVSAVIGPRERIILGFVGGVFVGLVILGWIFWPVDWKNAAPVDLHSGYRQIYLETVAHIYDINRDKLSIKGSASTQAQPEDTAGTDSTEPKQKPTRAKVVITPQSAGTN